MTITEFLLARIADDEAAGRDALEDGRGTREPWPWLAVGWPASEHPGPVVLVDPQRFLAECEAKRRIVGYRGAIGIPEDSTVEPGTGMAYLDGAHAAVAAERDRILRLLALPYSDHPDYDEAWRP